MINNLEQDLMEDLQAIIDSHLTESSTWEDELIITKKMFKLLLQHMQDLVTAND